MPTKTRHPLLAKVLEDTFRFDEAGEVKKPKTDAPTKDEKAPKLAEDLVLTGGGDKDILKGKAGNDRIFGEGGSDILKGGDGDDAIFGGDGADKMFGDAGRDLMFGGHGNDRLMGGAGDDYLSGNQGNDKMWGGKGADTFVFDGDFDRDIVRDFNAAEGDRFEFVLYDEDQRDWTAQTILDLAIQKRDAVEIRMPGTDDSIMIRNTDLSELSVEMFTVTFYEDPALA